MLGLLVAAILWNKNTVTAADTAKKTLKTCIVKKEQAQCTPGKTGDIYLYCQGDTEWSKDVLSGMIVVPPGQAFHPAHRHVDEEIITLVKGSGQWSLDGKESPANEGDVMYVEPWVMHGLLNTGKEPLSFFVVRWTGKGVEYPKEPAGDHGK